MVNARTVIVIGASARGVEALHSLAAQLPAGFPAAVPRQLLEEEWVRPDGIEVLEPSGG